MKKILSAIGILLLVFLGWYLLIKPYDYRVTFKVKTTAGTINQSLKIWNVGLENSTPINQESLSELTQNIKINDSTFRYQWSINSLNDSVSKVKVYIKDLDHSMANKISIPFYNTDFEKRTLKTVSDFTDKLLEHLKKIKVKVDGESFSRSTYCAYIPMKGLQVEKARGMMKNYSLLTQVLSADQVKMNGTPFVEVTEWNQQNDSIEYHFCFPIIKSDSLPKHPLIQYKQYQGVKSLKATYNGNYITSDRAWYALLEYADRNNIAIENKPVEVFNNNPNFGGNELRWEAEIYMPIKK